MPTGGVAISYKVCSHVPTGGVAISYKVCSHVPTGGVAIPYKACSHVPTGGVAIPYKVCSHVPTGGVAIPYNVCGHVPTGGVAIPYKVCSHVLACVHFSDEELNAKKNHAVLFTGVFDGQNYLLDINDKGSYHPGKGSEYLVVCTEDAIKVSLRGEWPTCADV